MNPYERQQTIGGELSPKADVHYQRNYISDALEKISALSDNIYRNMEKDKYDKYERDLQTAKDNMDSQIANSNDPAEWDSAYTTFTKYAEDHGKKFLGESLYNKWLGDADHGYGYKERMLLDYKMQTTPKLLNNAKAIRLENITQKVKEAYLEKDPVKAAKKVEEAYKLGYDKTLFSEAEIVKNKNEVEKNAAEAAFNSLLNSDNPDDALIFAEGKSFKDAIKDPSEIDKYRQVAQKRMEDVRFNKDMVNVATQQNELHKYFDLIASGDLRDVGEIEKLDIPPQYKNIFYTMMRARPDKSSGTGAGKSIEDLQLLANIDFEFQTLFQRDESKVGGYGYREGPSNMSDEQKQTYNSYRVNKGKDLTFKIMKAFSEGKISRDFALTRLTAIQGALYSSALDFGVGKKADKEKLPETYESGYARLNTLFQEYNITDPIEMHNAQDAFIGNVGKILAANNMTTSDLGRMSPQERDKIMVSAVGAVKQNIVNYAPFTSSLPDNTGAANSRIYSGAKTRYREKVLAYNQNLGDIDWANHAYDSQQKRDLEELGREAIREEVSHIQKTTQDMLTTQEVEDIYYGLEEEELMGFAQDVKDAILYNISVGERELYENRVLPGQGSFALDSYAYGKQKEISENIKKNKDFVSKIEKADKRTLLYLKENRANYENFIKEVEKAKEGDKSK